jgi:hypothetical protein
MEGIEKNERAVEKAPLKQRMQMLLAALATLHAVSGEPANAQSLEQKDFTETEESSKDGESESDRKLREDIEAGDAILEINRQVGEQLRKMREEQEEKIRKAQETAKKAAEKDPASTGAKGGFKSPLDPLDTMGDHLKSFGEANEIMGKILTGEADEGSLSRLKEIGEKVKESSAELSSDPPQDR